MIKSMTGFGKATAQTPLRKITVEVRSLNGKQLDLSLRIPPRYRLLDPVIRAAASESIERGKADISINVENTGAASAATINRQLLRGYYEQLTEAAAENGFGDIPQTMAERLFTSAIRMPEVVSGSTEELSEQEATEVTEVVKEALAELDRFRTNEGSVLIADIASRVRKIAESVSHIEPFEGERVETIRKKIEEGIEKLSVTVDPNRMEQEMIFYIEKFDVTEEKVRLANHCRYFEEVASSEKNPGRKLGFIAQEMGREINTLGSKANHAQIQKIVVGMKDELEKIKEQLLNIL